MNVSWLPVFFIITIVASVCNSNRNMWECPSFYTLTILGTLFSRIYVKNLLLHQPLGGWPWLHLLQTQWTLGTGRQKGFSPFPFFIKRIYVKSIVGFFLNFSTSLIYAINFVFIKDFYSSFISYQFIPLVI